MMTEVYSARFPHSEIAGSQDICSSPTLIAAYHVFRRLSVPRHPPCALCSMTTSMYSVTLMGRSFLWLKMCFINKKFDYLRFDVLSFSICSFQGTCSFGFKRLNPKCITRIELVLCIPIRIMHDLYHLPLQFFFYKAASTYSPVPSPVKYHRPPES